jgi:signal transduction histidine kinase
VDNGCGIPEQNIDKVFDPFFTTKPVGRGTGQGLAIARSIVVEKHLGIDIRSRVGEGTCFTLRLPVAGRGSKGPS